MVRKKEKQASDQDEALAHMLSGRNVFITGKAGTGKTHVLKKFLKKRKGGRRGVLVTAPTGIAALAVRGATLHSVFKIPFGICDSNAKIELPEYYKNVLMCSKCLIIDEISMVRADAMEHVYRKIQKFNPELQIIVIGDFFQLPPVVRNEEKSFFQAVFNGFYAFNSNAWEEIDFQVCYLKTVHRQNDKTFVDALNNVRVGIPSGLSVFSRCLGRSLDEKTTTLVTTNAMAHTRNSAKLNRLDGKNHVFEGEIEGDFNEKDAPCPYLFEVKIGATVLACVNHFEGDYVNGSVGTVVSVSKKFVEVDFGGKDCVLVEAHTWEILEYGYDGNENEVTEIVKGSFKQIPLKLGWAITIHKSQGMSIESVAIDLGRGAFAHGQTYVALSRATSLEGLSLLKPIRSRDLIVDRSVRQYMSRLSEVN